MREIITGTLVNMKEPTNEKKDKWGIKCDICGNVNAYKTCMGRHKHEVIKHEEIRGTQCDMCVKRNIYKTGIGIHDRGEHGV